MQARLSDGSEVYPHRDDLGHLPFWICDDCGNYVGCHHKAKKNKTKPLGCIPTPQLRKARNVIHAMVDPIWKDGHASRRAVYAEMSNRHGRQYHTANIRTMAEATEVLQIAGQLRREWVHR